MVFLKNVLLFLINMSIVMCLTKNRTEIAPCPQKLCNGKVDGNYELDNLMDVMVNSTVDGIEYFDYYLACSNGISYCRPCPEDTYFQELCQACRSELELENNVTDCYRNETTGPPLAAPDCPSTLGEITAVGEACKVHGADFSGNLVDGRKNPNLDPTALYVSCWLGSYVNCMACIEPLVFHEFKMWNSNETDPWGMCDHAKQEEYRALSFKRIQNMELKRN